MVQDCPNQNRFILVPDFRDQPAIVATYIENDTTTYFARTAEALLHVLKIIPLRLFSNLEPRIQRRPPFRVLLDRFSYSFSANYMHKGSSHIVKLLSRAIIPEGVPSEIPALGEAHTPRTPKLTWLYAPCLL